MEVKYLDWRISDWSRVIGFSNPCKSCKKTNINIFQIAGFPRRETVSSNVLAYFFDPNESHGLKGAFLHALLELLNEERRENGYDSYGECDEADVWTEYSGGNNTRNRIDIALFTPIVNIAIENKVDAPVYNDFNDYYKKIRKSDNGRDVNSCVVVLHAGKDLGLVETNSLKLHKNFFKISYDSFFDKVQAYLSEYEIVGKSDARVLLRHFIDNYSLKRNEYMMKQYNKTICEFVSKTEGIEREIAEIRFALGDYYYACREKMIYIQKLFEEDIMDNPIDGLKYHDRSFDDQGKRSIRHPEHNDKADMIICGQRFEVAGHDEYITISFSTPVDVFYWWEKNNMDLSNMRGIYNRILVKAFWGKENNNHLSGEHDRILDGIFLSDDDEKIIVRLRSYIEELRDSNWRE